jgi:hypothetical protein
MRTFAKNTAHTERFLLNNSYLCTVVPQKGTADMLKKRLALFHLRIWTIHWIMEWTKRSSCDGLYTYVYILSRV